MNLFESASLRPNVRKIMWSKALQQTECYREWLLDGKWSVYTSDTHTSIRLRVIKFFKYPLSPHQYLLPIPALRSIGEVWKSDLFSKVLFCDVREIRDDTVIIVCVDVIALPRRMFGMVLEKLIISDLQKVSGTTERKLCSVGYSKLLTSCSALLDNSYVHLWWERGIRSVLSRFFIAAFTFDFIFVQATAPRICYCSVWTSGRWFCSWWRAFHWNWGHPRSTLVLQCILLRSMLH